MAGVNVDDPGADQYSVLHLLKASDSLDSLEGGVHGDKPSVSMRNEDTGKFTFKLTYPKSTRAAAGTHYVVWKQASNPMTKLSRGVDG